MSLGRLFGFLRRGASAHEVAAVWTGPLDDTPIHRLLDAKGVPWRAARGDLAQRYGVRTDPAYGWPVIPIETPEPLIDGLIQPLHAQAFETLSPRAPASELFAVAWSGNDARRNIREAAAQLSAHLGPARVERQYNTMHAKWRFGRAGVELTVWPRDLQNVDVGQWPAHEKDPRLATGCHLQIRTGLRPPPSDAERAWLDSLVEIERIAPQGQYTPDFQRLAYAAPNLLEFIRDPQGYEHLTGLLGRSADGEGLILCDAQLYVVPFADVIGLKLDGLMPSRGPGGAWLYLVVATHEPDEPEKQITIREANAVGDLDETAARLAKTLGVPLTVAEPGDDI